jgi:ABC-type transport system substrate-binding protein
MRSTRASDVCAVAAIAIAIVGLGSVACRTRGAPHGARTTETPQRGGTFRWATLSDLGKLDPAVSFESDSQPIIELLFSGLVDYDLEGHVVPELAERWEMSADGKTYTFFLRRGVTMHDGSEVTADDVKRTAERAFHPDTPSPGAAFFTRLQGLADYQSGKAPHLSGVVVEGTYVVSFHLTEPDATFLQVLALPFLRPVCKNAGDRYDPAFEQSLCGAGPFRLATWEPGRFLRVERFDRFFKPGEPLLDAVEMRMPVTPLTQRFQIERGEIDYQREFTRPDVIFFRTHPEWSKYGREYVELSTYGELLNMQMKPFDDVRVRQAAAAAIDRPHLAEYFEGLSHVTGHLIPPGVPGYDPNYEGQTYDLDRARALMAAAGYAYDPKTGTGGCPETIPYLVGEAESAVRLAQLVQYDLAQIGLRIELRVVSASVYYTLVGRPKTVPIGYVGWNMDFPDPSDFFEPTLTTASIQPEDSSNWSFYSNPRLDDLVARAHVELDEDKRMAMYHEAERIVVDDAPWAFTYNPIRYEMMQPYVRGLDLHPVWRPYFRHVWIDQAGARTAKYARPLFGSGALGAMLRAAPWNAADVGAP